MGRYVSLAGVIVGGICDILLTNILLIPIVAIVAVPLLQAHVSSADSTAQIKATMAGSGFTVLALLIGAIGSIAGGFIAASIAKREELLNGLLSAWLCIVFGFAGFFTGVDLLHRLLPLIEIPLAAAFGTVGGYLRYRMVHAKRLAV